MDEITADDIALLTEGDVRTLVGLLCEAEARKHGFSSSCVTWGGNQNATDGGLDVHVELPPNAQTEGYVPRPATGLQVKKPDIPPAKIAAEMRPRGKLRQVIRELANRSGAYIIVSSVASTSDTALEKRRAAMRRAVSELVDAESLHVDFYDGSRLATWVRDHGGLILWVRGHIGKAIPGWHPYEAWAYPPDGVDGVYLLDDKIRVQTTEEETGGGIDALDAIQRIRERLRFPRGVVRLVGLSGVGKTRLAQALFDARIGKDGLDPSLASYTNIADEPDPQPTGLISDLIAAGTRAIVIVDNCPPDLHRRLSELCRSPESPVSILTIEYDIREDQPEGTDVFELQPSSRELIEKLVQRRFSTLSGVDASRIAEFSGGNARIAIALAETIDRNETITGLKDEELFQRLFHQRHQPDESLLLAAQACSLVYSFNGDDVSDGSDAELVRLGTTIGKDPREMFRHVAELRRRDLVQRRGVWRAVLPHAIANRLAMIALQNIPFAVIEENLVDNAPERLLKSFSRRLGFLPDSRQAAGIVEKWLAPNGLLHNVTELNELGSALFENIAPVAPEAVLSTLERALLGQESTGAARHCARWVRLLRSLAYDATLFERSVELLLKIAEAADANDKSNEAKNAFSFLFFIIYSGTHATVEQRLRVVESLLRSDDAARRGLGVTALEAALEAWQFTQLYGFEFGARSRDYGYWPKDRSEVERWFRLTLNLVENVGCGHANSAPQVREALAKQFRGLWSKAAMYDELDRVCRAISANEFWPDGWIAVRTIQRFDAAGFGPEIVEKLDALERVLRPKELVEKVQSVVLSSAARLSFDVDIEAGGDTGDVQTAYARLEATAEDLGKGVAADNDAFERVLPDLLTGEGRLWLFGRGLCKGSEDPARTWKRLLAQLAATSERDRRVQVLGGFLYGLGERDPELANTLLDEAVDDDVVGPSYPVLQASLVIDKRGFDRIMHSLKLGKAPIQTYRMLVAGRLTDPIPGDDFKRMVLEIAARSEGYPVALEIVYMRLHSERDGKQGYTADVLDAGRELLRQIRFTRHNREDHRFGEIAKMCLAREADAAIVQEICRKLRDAISKYETHMVYNDDLLHGLFAAHPTAVLDELFACDAAAQKVGVRIVDEGQSIHGNPLDVVPDNTLLSWCDQDPHNRYPLVARLITISPHLDKPGKREWTSIALRLLDKAPDRVQVLRQFTRQFSPMGWSGSLAAAMESNVKLLDELESHGDAAVTQFVAQERSRLRVVIDEERRSETAMDRELDERFE